MITRGLSYNCKDEKFLARSAFPIQRYLYEVSKFGVTAEAGCE